MPPDFIETWQRPQRSAWCVDVGWKARRDIIFGLRPPTGLVYWCSHQPATRTAAAKLRDHRNPRTVF
jgi:hypothetical protein